MTIKRFADKYKLKISRDDCGDAVIRGKHGHIYVDTGMVCAMWVDAAPMNKSRLVKLGGTFWQGDISTDVKGRRLQDTWSGAFDRKPTSWRSAWWGRNGGG